MKKLFLYVVLGLLFCNVGFAEKIILRCKLLNLVEKGWDKNEEIINLTEIDTSGSHFYMNGFLWNELKIYDNAFIATNTNPKGDLSTWTIDRYTGKAVSHTDYKDEVFLSLIEEGEEGPWNHDGIYQCEKTKKKF